MRGPWARASLLLTALSAPASAQEAPFPSLAGSGLLTLPTAATLPAGGVSAALNVDNRDRDPLGLDLLDGSLVLAVGLRPGLEAYGHAVFSRVVSLPEPPALPPPPLDLVVAPGAALPPLPHYALYAPTPYVNKRGTARFDAFVPGEAVLGAKVRLRAPEGLRPGLALAGEIKLPLSRDGGHLQSGSGTGGLDLRVRLAGEWRAGPATLLAASSFTYTGAGARGDRWIVVERTGAARLTERELALPERLGLGVGAALPLPGALRAVLEASTELEVGGGTPSLDPARAVDVIGGVQARLGGARVAAALRYHGNALPSGERRPSPLAGLVDVSAVAPQDLAAYLRALGAEAAASLLREGGQRVVAAPAGGPALPPGARRLAPDYVIRSEHQLGFVLTLGWEF